MSSGNPDIRQQVEENRGALKKLQLLIPGLRGYRSREDVRVSDELLRNQMADKLDRVKGNLEGLRKDVLASGGRDSLTTIGSLIAQVQSLSGEVRHAAQGYSGWVAPIQIQEDKLNKLYDYDYSFVSSIGQLDQSTAPGAIVFDPGAPGALKATLGQISRTVDQIRHQWSERIEAIEGIAVK